MRWLEGSGDQRGELRACFRMTENRRLRDRCRAVLIAARGRHQQQIAKELGTDAAQYLWPLTAGCLTPARRGRGKGAEPFGFR